MPLILAQNEITVDPHFERWKDIEGIQYHFPNQYKNKIVEGETFIYYRSSRRRDGRKKTPEYFGFGKIGKKWIDPESIGNGSKTKLEWFCDIIDYVPFLKPVSFNLNGNYFEKITQNLWGVGVRSIDNGVYKNILEAAGIISPDDPYSPAIEKAIPELNKVNARFIEEGSSLIIPTYKFTVNDLTSESAGAPRYSKYSKIYGDRSEEIVFKILKERPEYKLRWVAQIGEKPGWDIEFYRGKNEIAVEVKGTSGKRFKNIEITAGEWKAAEQKKENYNLYLIADCLSENPLIQIINNPFDLYIKKKISLSPTNYRITFNETMI